MMQQDRELRDEYIRTAEVLRVIDGDTLEISIDLGFKLYKVAHAQLQGVDAEPIRGEEKTERGLKAKEFVEETLPKGSKITIQTHHEDGFGRWVSDIFFEDGGEQVNLGDLLVQSDLADVIE